MTIGEYIRTTLNPYGVNETTIFDILLESGMEETDDYTAENQAAVGRALCKGVESILFQPRLKSISENGFSETWDYANLGKFYLWLCRKWGVKPDEEATAALDMNVITDRTGKW
jgi:hypothetical protein